MAMNISRQLADVEVVTEDISVSPVYSLDSPQDQAAASLLYLAGRYMSGPVLSDGRGWT